MQNHFQHLQPTAHANGNTHATPSNHGYGWGLFGPKGNQPGSVNYFNGDWVSTSAFMILMMQLGFALLEAGCVRYKNSSSIVIKIILNTTVTILVWWAIGYGISFGDDSSGFLGTTKYFTSKFVPQDYINFVMQTAQATVAASIMSGGTAERMTFSGWVVTTIVFSGWVYPIACHWIFGGGWLTAYGYHDYAGGGAIHLVGGTGALVTTLFLKPRLGRFTAGNESYFTAYNQLFVAFGTLLLYACWLFFNSGNVLGGDHDEYVAGLVSSNTFLAGSAGSLVACFLHYASTGKTGLVPLCNGMLTGLVAITGACDNVHTWAAITIGAIGGVTYFTVAKILVAAQVDDPIDAVPVHFGGGLIGTFLTGFFDQSGGLFYGGDGTLFGCQLLGILVLVAWSATFNSLILALLKGYGWLRISEANEKRGIDQNICDGESVDSTNYSELEVKEYVPQVDERQAQSTPPKKVSKKPQSLVTSSYVVPPLPGSVYIR